jgi:hypothetical protein
MNKKILLPILLVVAIVLGYYFYKSIESEVEYVNQVEKVHDQVVGRLDSLGKMELAYKDVHGEYTDDFNKLFDFMVNGKYFKIKEVGESDGEVKNVVRDTTFLNPMEVVFKTKDIDISQMYLVPPLYKDTFEIFAGKINQGNVDVPVIEIKDPKPFNKNGKALKFGDRNSAVASGNWR